MNYLLRDTYHLFVRHWRASIRMPVWLLSNLLQPLLWLVLYGQLFKKMVLLPGFPTGSYLQFFAPGVITMTAYFGSGWSGMSIINDIDHGVIDRMLTTPVNRTSIILGRVLHSAVTAAIQGIIVLVLSSILGARVASGIPGIVLIALIAMLIGVIFASFSNALAIILKREDPVIAVLEFILMPFMFMSTIMMPSRFMPGWIYQVSRVNPVNWTVESIRTLMVTGLKWGSVLPYLEALISLSVIAVILATMSFRQLRP